MNETQLEEIALKHDLIVTWWTQSTGADRALVLHHFNPRLIILAYWNVRCINEASQSNEIAIARANGWMLKDGNGSEIFKKSFPDHRFLDIGNTNYQEWVADMISSQLKDGFDGVLGEDSCCWVERHLMSSEPINPRTGQSYTDFDWCHDLANLIRTIKSRMGNAPYITQGVGLVQGSGDSGYWNREGLAEPVLLVSNGCQIEGYVRWTNESWRSESEWLEDLRFHQYLCDRGDWSLCMVKCNNLSKAEADQLAMYGLASYLLVKNGQFSYFCANGYDDRFLETINENIGFPLEIYHRCNVTGVYEREYSSSLVLVNPTQTAFSIDFDKNYRTLDDQVISSVTVAAHSANILYKT
jgi:hypothetical protein